MVGERNKVITWLLSQPEDKTYEANVKREHRSLNANSYYWVLAGKLAPVQNISTTRLHNMMIRDYGQREFIGDRVVNVFIPDTEGAEQKSLDAETYHIKPTSQVVKGFRTYVLMRGSSTYDTKEMSILLDGMISECEQSGIETMTPDELERLKGYEKQENKGM